MLRAVQDYGIDAPWPGEEAAGREAVGAQVGPTPAHVCDGRGSDVGGRSWVQEAGREGEEGRPGRRTQAHEPSPRRRAAAKEEVTEADVATRQRNKHIGSSLDDWLKEESAKDPSFAAGLEERFDKYRLAQELKAMREQAGLSQKQLAERVHTKQPSIARLERARVLPKLDLLQRVARALGAEVVVSFRRIPSNPRRNRVASAIR